MLNAVETIMFLKHVQNCWPHPTDHTLTLLMAALFWFLFINCLVSGVSRMFHTGQNPFCIYLAAVGIEMATNVMNVLMRKGNKST